MPGRVTPSMPGAFATFWLIYLVFVFFEPYVARAPLHVWAISAASIGAFLPLYFGAFRNVVSRPRRAIGLTAAMAVLGLALVPTNIGGSTYVIFAASAIGFIMSRRLALQIIAALAILLVVDVVLTREPFELWMLFQPMIVVMVGVGNVLVVEERRRNAVVSRAREDVEEIAKLAERERIGRDLHDLLGHTLSVIALKSELASKLADRDPQQAILEIRDVERVSRQALTEVRHAVEGYRTTGLSGELANAGHALGIVGITLEREMTLRSLSALLPRHETVLALALREAVTNVVRHAGATRCRVALTDADGRITLRVEDDGVGGMPLEGNGLSGMRERLRAVGGSVAIDGHHGMRLTVTLPVASPTEAQA